MGTPGFQFSKGETLSKPLPSIPELAKASQVSLDRVRHILDRFTIPGFNVTAMTLPDNAVEVTTSQDCAPIQGSTPPPGFDPSAPYILTVQNKITLPSKASDREILNAILHATLSLACHEIQEQAHYDGERLVNPHKVGEIFDNAVSGYRRNADCWKLSVYEIAQRFGVLKD